MSEWQPIETVPKDGRPVTPPKTGDGVLAEEREGYRRWYAHKYPDKMEIARLREEIRQLRATTDAPELERWAVDLLKTRFVSYKEPACDLPAEFVIVDVVKQIIRAARSSPERTIGVRSDDK